MTKKHNQIKFEIVADQIFKVYGQQSILPILFGLASIFRDEIKSEEPFPILFLKGRFTTGKSSLSSFIQRVFDTSKNTDGVMYYGLEHKYLEKLNSSGLLRLDDYRSSPQNDAGLKAIVDGRVISIGTNSSNNSPVTYKMTASVIVCSAAMPEEETVACRFILVENQINVYSQLQTLRFDHLNQFFKNNNCNCSDEILLHKNFVKENF